jgi:hypothetical protein
MKRIVVVFSLLFWCLPAFGQSFSDDPAGAIKSSVTLAQEIVNDPLRLDGLKSIVFRYNSARSQWSPAGYEQKEWLNVDILPILREINSKANSLKEVGPLPDEQTAEMLAAFNKNKDIFYSFYNSSSTDLGFGNIPPDQMLGYLSAYAVIANSVDNSLWKSLSSFTGVWPLCFWNR